MHEGWVYALNSADVPTSLTYTDIVYIGTLLHYDALLANVAKNPEYEAVRYKGVISFATNTALWDAWERIFTDLENPKHKEDAEDFFKANEAEMLEGTAVLWEEKLPYYALMVMRVSEGEASFSSEIQNEPRPGELRVRRGVVRLLRRRAAPPGLLRPEVPLCGGE